MYQLIHNMERERIVIQEIVITLDQELKGTEVRFWNENIYISNDLEMLKETAELLKKSWALEAKREYERKIKKIEEVETIAL